MPQPGLQPSEIPVLTYRDAHRFGYDDLVKSNPDLVRGLDQPAIIDYSYAFARDMQIVNGMVNEAIRATGIDNKAGNGWTEKGACADYAVEKLKMMIGLGYPRGALRLTEATIRTPLQLHAVLTVDTSKGTWVMDNLSSNPYLWNTKPNMRFDSREGAGGRWEVLSEAGR